MLGGQAFCILGYLCNLPFDKLLPTFLLLFHHSEDKVPIWLMEKEGILKLSMSIKTKSKWGLQEHVSCQLRQCLRNIFSHSFNLC